MVSSEQGAVPILEEAMKKLIEACLIACAALIAVTPVVFIFIIFARVWWEFARWAWTFWP